MLLNKIIYLREHLDKILNTVISILIVQTKELFNA